MGNQLENKYAVVTGGGKGIVRAIVERFLEENAAGVAIIDYDIETAGKTVEELNEDRVFAVKCDVSSVEQVEEAFAKALERMGRIDILINNAGLTRDKMMHNMTYEQWDTVLNANLKGAFICMKQVIPGMRERMYGKIVNISSTAAYGNAGQTNYSASKAGIMGLTCTAAKELGPKNITVNAVAPGYIATDILRTVRKISWKKIRKQFLCNGLEHRRNSQKWFYSWLVMSPAILQVLLSYVAADLR